MSVVSLLDAGDARLFGGKAAQLSAAIAAGLPVPAGFAVSTHALDALARGDASVTARVRTLSAALTQRVAARSSALGEDSEHASFAGQHLTLLNLQGPEEIVTGLARVHASAESPAALAYRQKRGIAGPPRMAAVVQQLVEAHCAGVLFTRHPVTHAEEYVIEAAWGLGEAVVAGLVTPDHYRLTYQAHLLERRIGEKDISVQWDAESGTREVPVPAARVFEPCLDAAWLARLCALAARCQTCFGCSLDLEWACTRDTLYLLQVRPISTGSRG